MTKNIDLFMIFKFCFDVPVVLNYLNILCEVECGSCPSWSLQDTRGQTDKRRSEGLDDEEERAVLRKLTSRGN